MHAVILIGIQGSGKSAFYARHFAATHARLNLDTLKTRHRELKLLVECLQRKAPFVADNTNVTAAARQRYIAPAREAGYRVAGYFFEPVIADCLRRNEAREGKERIPKVGLFGTLKRLERPRYAEGFDELLLVQLRGEEFVIEPYVEPPALEGQQ